MTKTTVADPLLVGPLANCWRKPELVELGRLPMRPPLSSWSTARAARRGHRTDSDWYQSLDGEWKFLHYERPEDVPASAVADVGLRSAGGSAKWSNIAVPGVWTRQGWDSPHYTNVQMPWEDPPPHVPDANPTGVYRTSFKLQSGWKSRRTILTLGGAETIALVWCNGRFVGLSTDSRLEAEFDLSEVVRTGDNTLVVVVIRWAAATWLEDQDHWHHAGLHRSVSLRSVGQTHVADVAAAAVLGADGRKGTLSVQVEVDQNDQPDAGWSVEMQLEGPDGKRVPLDDAAKPFKTEVAESHKRSTHINSYGYLGPYVNFEFSLPTVEAWSHEQPTLYRLITVLKNAKGKVVQATGQWIGFTEVKILDRQLLLNGQPVLIYGVNRHDHHHETGKTLTRDEIKAELLLMKQYGFNAVRTAHYPNDPDVVELCSEIGLWMVSEANVETHARIHSLVHDARWTPSIMARMQRLVMRDRSQPCVFAWSLGNESGYGTVHDSAAAWVRSTDPNRIVQYEGAMGITYGKKLVDAGGAAASDVTCPMYSSIEDVEAWAKGPDQRPLIQCEYSHAMGNSNGSLHEYWEQIENTHGAQGGFIWDWRDQGLVETDADGTEFFSYGGHYGHDRHDAAFCLNGMVGPDLTLHPAMDEHAKLAEMVRFEPADLRRGRVRVTNRQWWTDLSGLRCRYSVTIDGLEVDSGLVKLPKIEPQACQTIELKLERPDDMIRGQVAHLELHLETAEKTAWCPRGFCAVSAQLELPWKGRGRPPVPQSKPYEADVDEVTGALSIDDFITSAPQLCLWRAPVDNDYDLAHRNEVAGALVWAEWGVENLKVTDTAVTGSAGRGWVVRRTLVSGDGTEVSHVQRITPSEEGVHMHEDVRLPKQWDDLGRVGVRFQLRDDLQRLEWLGLGPHETTSDRTAAAHFGRWNSTVADQPVPYVRPQHMGTHVGTSWAELRTDQGRGLRIEGEEAFTFSALPHSLENITAAATSNQLVSDGVYVHLDRAVRGVGTGACGPATRPAYRLKGGRHRWSWGIRIL